MNATIQAALIATGGALGAAIFAFLSALMNARIARKNAILQARIAQRIKRAEFRQAWINSLRDSFVALQNALVIRPDGFERAYSEHSIRVLLSMNNEDSDYHRLRKSAARIARSPAGKDGAADAHLEFIEICQAILKREWEATKAELDHMES